MTMLPTTLPLALLALSILLALPGLWLLFRQKPPLPRHNSVAATVLLLAATASGYIGVRLLLGSPAVVPASTFALKPANGQFQVIRAEELPTALMAAHGRVVMLELYADWCPSCITWKQQVFNRSDVQAALLPLVLLQIDASEMTPAVQTLLTQHQLPGLPAILIFDRNGHEQSGLRLLGEMPAEEFKTWIGSRLSPLL